MTYLITYAMFEFFYLIIYCLPLGIAISILDYFNLPSSIKTPLEFVLMIIAIVFLFGGGYRAKIATDCRVNSNMSLSEAHKSAGAIIKVNLSYIPIINFFFKKTDK